MATLQQPERGPGRREDHTDSGTARGAPQPSTRPTRPARSARRLRHIGALFAALVATTLPASGHAADINKGAELYRLHCAACHGGDGRPLMPGATDFSRPSSLLKPDLALLGVMRAGKGAMPAYQGQLRDREMLDIIAHLRTHQ
jgi:cytochrome c6